MYQNLEKEIVFPISLIMIKLVHFYNVRVLKSNEMNTRRVPVKAPIKTNFYAHFLNTGT